MSPRPLPTLEVNFDGMVGPTHNYGGLAQGNLASQQNRRLISRPRAAALQGLEKMRFLMNLGVPQGVLPPQDRPALGVLRALGFSGTESEIVGKAAKGAPELLAACYSASSMWAANAATISPSADCGDGLLHVTPANLHSHLHRSIETSATARTLEEILPGPLFAHHAALPGAPETADEGAANHHRLCLTMDSPGLEIFTYGHDAGMPAKRAARYRARQTRAASEAVARLHGLSPERVLFFQQHPDALDAGAFHNDVLAVAHRNILFCHERAFADQAAALEQMRQVFAHTCGGDLIVVEVPERVLSLADAVRCYLFNSQIVSLPDNTQVLLAPSECTHAPGAQAAIDLFRQQAPIREVYFVDVRQSMRNGGGPACLRLRVVLTAAQQRAMHPGVRLTHPLYQKLRGCIEQFYREELAPGDLADPNLVTESRMAVAEVRRILGLSCRPAEG